MAAVMIGVDPHKGSHTAMAVGADEGPLGQVRVRASAAQAERLLAWAAAWPERTWAVEGAGGLGHLLAQQLVSAGERVLDVQPKLAARVRLLAAGAVNKNDPNDARSVAIVALRSAACLPVRPDDHAAVLKIWVCAPQHQLSLLWCVAICWRAGQVARSSRGTATLRRCPPRSGVLAGAGLTARASAATRSVAPSSWRRIGGQAGTCQRSGTRRRIRIGRHCGSWPIALLAARCPKRGGGNPMSAFSPWPVP